MIDRFKPVGSTAEDDFLTRKDVVAVDSRRYPTSLSTDDGLGRARRPRNGRPRIGRRAVARRVDTGERVDPLGGVGLRGPPCRLCSA